METVQLQCGHCQKVMAIGVEHLGGQVQCPHCKGVVQTPARSAPAEAPAPPSMELPGESIFAGPEASDAVIGESAAPQVEMPTPPSAEAPADAASVPETSEMEAEFKRFKPRPVYDKGVFTLYAMIFLVPYAILSTLAILYLLFMRGGSTHPLDMMPDPVPDKGKGGAKTVHRTIHTLPLADHQKVALRKSLQVGKDGDLLVTPEKVVWTEDGDLRLFLRAKNTSTNTAFEPANESWIKYVVGKTTEPYTFVESKSQKIRNIYGAYLGYRKNSQDANEVGSAILGPNQETTVVLTTYPSELVAAIAKSNDTYTWRVQLRRGFVNYRGKDVSTTAVIGVEFTTAQIEGKRS